MRILAQVCMGYKVSYSRETKVYINIRNVGLLTLIQEHKLHVEADASDSILFITAGS